MLIVLCLVQSTCSAKIDSRKLLRVLTGLNDVFEIGSNVNKSEA